MSRRSETTTKVFVGSLPADATTDDLRRLFQPYGAIAECDIANRCGFLHLEDKDLAMKAIEELNNTTFMGVRISVEKGRVKPPNRNRGRGGASGGGVGPMRGGRDRGGPYTRDTFGRSRGGGYGARDYPAYGDPYDYDRSAMPRYDSGYGMDRRPPYDDRRGGYMTDRPYPNGYDDRRPYDDRTPYPDTQRSAYDDRRMPAPTPAGGYDDRRTPMGDRRPLMDTQMGQPPRAPMSSYDRTTSSDMFSRRDTGLKPLDRPAGAYSSPTGGYSTGTTTGTYGTSSTMPAYGGYGDTRGTTSMTYDTRGSVQSGAYGDTRGPTATSGYDSRAMPPMTSSMYPDTRTPATTGTYGTAAPTTGYNSASTASYGDAYGTRTGSYDAAYPPLPQQRGGYASGNEQNRSISGRRYVLAGKNRSH